MVVFAGFPLMFLELSFGQYGSLGVVSIWKACPLFQGKLMITTRPYSLDFDWLSMEGNVMEPK